MLSVCFTVVTSVMSPHGLREPLQCITVYFRRDLCSVNVKVEA